eukprot:CAMPEP_0113847420 /NCGR_PEP_ID=MMETSP0372-20130328/1863_1 /TAXON_ID=340204 /ORGANISM="Lankesteria abbotti" /LENGTH=151 /DNA_ID=CAMNT_0000816693 /DNA_START=52 /DNA_END=507 /DNA_ORIENTATION=+ /assembly_acc=CAM_ASM_000359
MADLGTKRVQTFGRKKNAVAVAICTEGKGRIKVNGVPLELVSPESLRVKTFEPLLLLRHRLPDAANTFAHIDIKVSVKGGGPVAQIYATRQALAKGVVAYNQKFTDEATKKMIRDIFVSYDRSLVVSDPRRCEPKKFGGKGARARFQKSYR